LGRDVSTQEKPDATEGGQPREYFDVTVDAFDVALEFKLRCVEVPGDRLTLTLTIDGPNDPEFYTPGRYLPGRTYSLFQIPASVFPDEEKRAEWVEATRRAFKKTLLDTLMHEARLNFTDAANHLLDHMGLDRTSKKELLESHIKATAERVRIQFRVGGKGRYSKWTRLELARDVTAALQSLPVSERTLANVAARLKEAPEPKKREKAPVSGEALRKLLSRFKIEWEQLMPDS